MPFVAYKVEPSPWSPPGLPRAAHCSQGLPYALSSMGVLVHRVKTATLHNIHRTGSHYSYGFWCGMHGCTNFHLYAEPPEGHFVCMRCEAAAIANGEKSSDELLGRHVHVGGVKAIQKCCVVEDES